jgi:hypothetical protein
MKTASINGQVLIALFTIVVIFFFWSGGSKKSRQVTTTTVVHQRYYSNPPRNPLNKPPGFFSMFIVCASISILMIISSIALSEWNSSITSYKENDDPCIGPDYNCPNDLVDFFTINADMGFEVGGDLPMTLSPNGPYYWIGFIVGSLLMIVGVYSAENRRYSHKNKLKEAEKRLRPTVRRLAMDPNGVVEGRIRLPEAIPISKPTKFNERLIILIYAISALMLILTFLSIGSYFSELANDAPSKKWGDNMTPKHDAQAFLLILLLLLHTTACQKVVKYLFAEYEGEDDSMIPIQARRQSIKVEENRIQKLSSEPATASDVLEALSREMEAAKAEAALLRQELDETRNKVKGLETELDEKTVELESIQEITKSMEKIVEENKDAGDKSLSLNDSVMVGDNLFNGDKIDKQIINDPEAIARAAIEAYREGQRDRSKIDLDFD